MAAEQDLKLDTPEEAPSGGGKKKLILIIVGALLLVGIAVGVTWFLMSGGDDAEGEEMAAEEMAPKEEVMAEETEIPAQYVVLKPEFVVSFQVGTRQRFLQVSIEVMTRKQTVVDALSLHEPMIRNDIIRIMGEQDFNELRTAEGRVALQKQLLKHLQMSMKREAGSSEVEAVLFTNFVMQ